MNLSTQRIVQPSSFDESFADVKSSTQCSKQRCTRLEYICPSVLVGSRVVKRLENSYVHKLCHLLLLHALGEFALLVGVKTAPSSDVIAFAA